MSAFVVGAPGPLHANGVLPQQPSVVPAAARLEQPKPRTSTSTAAAGGAALLGAGLAATARGRAGRRARGVRLQARGGSAAAPALGFTDQRQNDFSLEAALKPQEKSPMVSEDTGGAGLASAAPEAGKSDEDDASSRVRFLAPLAPLAVLPLIQAKESAQRTTELLASTSPAGSPMYALSGWTPDVSTPCYESIYRYFPRAMPATPVYERSKLAMSSLGLIPGNTIFGSSLCPDEINNKPGGVLDQVTKFWGEQFPLGGLGGVPLVGKTGWGAFSHHVPDNGNIFVLYGPHVGVSEEGLVGKIKRPGQDELSSACGAFVGAYKQTASWTGTDEEITGLDMQQQFIRNSLGPLRPQVESAQNPMAELARKAFQIVDKQLLSIIDLECCDKLVLLGGIQVNTPDGYPDHFEPMRFEVMQKGKANKDLMRAFNPAIDPLSFFRDAAKKA